MASQREAYFQSKASDRIQIINLLAAAAITVLSVLLAISDRIYSPWIVIQLSVSIPLLVTSSLAYAKIAYRPESECPSWDTLGWVTLSLGYNMILNAVALMLYATGYSLPAVVFLLTALAAFIAYTLVDLAGKRGRLKEKSFKLSLYAFCLFLGGALPILAGWL
jgi:hypothetical protein